MLARLPHDGNARLIGAMAVIERLLGEPGGLASPAILREPRPGDMGWVVQSHGSFYARVYGFDSSFEGLVAEIAAKFLASFDASRERCWIAEIDGQQVGSIFLVRHTDDIAKLRLLLVDPAGRGQGLGNRLVGECIAFATTMRLSPDHAVDPEHSGRRPQDLSGGRVQAGRHRAAPQFRPGPDRRNLGTRTVKPVRRAQSVFKRSGHRFA